jgi:hypothetical protein
MGAKRGSQRHSIPAGDAGLAHAASNRATPGWLIPARSASWRWDQPSSSRRSLTVSASCSGPRDWDSSPPVRLRGCGAVGLVSLLRFGGQPSILLAIEQPVQPGREHASRQGRHYEKPHLA